MKTYSDLKMVNSHVVVGKRTVIKFVNMSKYAIDIRDTKFCSVDINDQNSLGILLPKGINTDLIPEVTMDVWVEGYSALEFTFKFTIIKETLEQEMFVVVSEPLRMLRRVPVTLHGPAGHSYRIDTKKSTGDVLDHEYIRKDSDWTPVGDPVNLTMQLDNGQRTASLNYVVRSDLRKGNTIKFNRQIATIQDPTVRAVHTPTSNNIQLGSAHNLLVKGGEPILTDNRYIAGIQFGEDTFRLVSVPNEHSCNASSLRNNINMVISAVMVYDRDPYIEIKTLDMLWKVSLLRTIYKEGVYTELEGRCKFVLHEDDVIMSAEKVPGYDYGAVHILLRKPSEECMWRRNEPTTFSTDGVKHCIEGPVLPNRPFAIKRVHSQTGVVYIKSIPSTGFIQVEH